MYSHLRRSLSYFYTLLKNSLVLKKFNLPFGIDNLLFPLVFYFSTYFVVGGEISVKSVIFGQKVAASRVWSIYQSVINIFVILADSVSEARLLYLLSISHLISLISCARCNIGKVCLDLRILVSADNIVLMISSS